jgi:hypothetical protein
MSEASHFTQGVENQLYFLSYSSPCPSVLAICSL